MIRKNTNPVLITTLKENDVTSVIDWFEQQKLIFYLLGMSYFKKQEQIEELFYRTILKVHKELPRFRNETSLETWLTSTFIHTCRELFGDKTLVVSEDHEQRPELFEALDSLKENEKEALVLTYMKGFSREETAQLLKIPEEEIKKLLFSGIQSLRRGMGYREKFNGCKEYQTFYIDYLERTLERPEKIDLEVHIYRCQDCQEDLATFQEVMLTLVNLTEKLEDFHVPTGFMEKVKQRIALEEQQRRQKNEKFKKRGLVFACVFALLMGIGFFTGVFSNLYYTWAEEDEELRAFLQEDLGERLNLEAESDGVIIRIKSAIADDIQTVVFYEIEDTNEDNQYFLNLGDGVFVENEREILSSQTHPRYYPPDLESELNNEKKNVYQGKVSLLPIKKESGTIELKITKLLKLVRKSDGDRYSPYGNPEFETGEWNFNIPVTKQPSKEYALAKETEIEGIPIRFEKLTVAPTATILQYAINNEKPEKRISNLIFDSLEVNDRIVKADLYGSTFVYGQNERNWESLQVQFGSAFGEKPNDVNIHIESAHVSFQDEKSIELDASQEYPQTFEYAGSTLSIDKVDFGPPAEVVISNHEVEGRTYETIHFDIVGEDEMTPSSLEMSTEGMLVDKSGKVYDINKGPFIYEEIEQPRYFLTVQRMKLHSNSGEEDVVPKWLKLHGYNSTVFLDEVIKLKVD